MKKTLCVLLIVCIGGLAFAKDYYRSRDFEAELEEAQGSKDSGWGTYALGLGLMLVGVIAMLATYDPYREDNTLSILVGGGATIGGSLIVLAGLPSVGADYSKISALEYVIAHPDLDFRTKTAIADNQIYLGMKEEHLIASWGKPHDINSSVGTWGIHKQYVYGSYSAYSSPQYVYVENGEVVSWQS